MKSNVKTSVRVIRPATESDAAHLASLSGELGYPATAQLMRERLVRVLSHSGELVLLAEQSGAVVGWIHGSEQELLESGSRCEILGLVVTAEHRGTGIGRELVAALERWASGRGLEQISVRSNVLRTESHPFYERLGYVRAKTQHAYRKALAPTASPRSAAGPE
jgi:GNAT superfamily N-acetyltransferase